MKYLVVQVRNAVGDDDRLDTYPILEEAMAAYQKAKSVEGNDGVYLCAILKEIDL